MKELSSGIMVDLKIYYLLLEWRDQNDRVFQQWCSERGLGTRSIYRIPTKELYNDLLEITNIKNKS